MCHKSSPAADDFENSLIVLKKKQNHVYEEGAYGGYFKNYARVQQQSPAAKIRNPAYMSILFSLLQVFLYGDCVR